jgi:hypothetical protein
MDSARETVFEGAKAVNDIDRVCLLTSLDGNKYQSLPTLI